MDTTDSTISIEFGNSLLIAAREYVRGLYSQQRLDQKLVFHNLKSTIELVDYTNKIGQGEYPVENNWDAAVLAAWFCFTGYLTSYEHPLTESINHLDNFSKHNSVDDLLLLSTKAIIGTCFRKKGKGTNAEAIFRDAVKVLLYGPDFKANQNLIQYEIELNGGEEVERIDYQNLILSGLLSAQLVTPSAIRLYGQVLSQNIISTRKQVKKLNPDHALQSSTERFAHIEDGVPKGGIQSYFRSIYRVHINLSAIADNKANIMISVNAILISVLISLLSYKNLSETNPRVMLPVLVFIVAGLTSLIFAVLSARPKVTYPNKGITDRNVLKKNTIFFGSFVTMKLDEYEDIMDEVFQDGKLIYGNMIRDMYYLGKVLDKKYQYLIISYNIFMIGFAITVLSFLAILFIPV